MSMMWSHLSHFVTCGHTCHMWSHLSHFVTLCHMWSYLSHVVTLVTCGHTCHMWSNLSHVVTCGHIRSHLSHMITLVTRNQYFIQQLTKKCIRFLTRTRPTYRPAWPQVKINFSEMPPKDAWGCPS